MSLPYMLTRKFIEVIDRVKPGYHPRVVFDIGSRDLEQSIEFKKTYPSAVVYAFEPNPNQTELCKKLASENNIVFYPYALGKQNGTLTFYITEGNIGASSLLKPIDVPFADNKTITETKVLVTTMKDFIEFTDFPYYTAPDVLWMDVQGLELDVLKSAGDWIDNVNFIHCEAAEVGYYEGHNSKSELINFLESKGFETMFLAENWHPYGEGDIIAYRP